MSTGGGLDPAHHSPWPRKPHDSITPDALEVLSPPPATTHCLPTELPLYLPPRAIAALATTIGHSPHRDGSRINDDELGALPCGRPDVCHARTIGRWRSPRRQVRLPESTRAIPDT